MARARCGWVAWAALVGAVFVAACTDDASGGTTTAATAASSAESSGSGGSFTCNDAGVDANDKAPTVEIVEPADGQTFKLNEIVPLKGTATDVVDGNITSPLQLFWFKDVVDPTGEGTEDSVDPAEDGALTAGMHPITFKAVNSRCLEASATVNIVVQ